MHYTCPICETKLESKPTPVVHTCIFNPEKEKVRGIYNSVETGQGVKDIVQIKISRKYEKLTDKENGVEYGLLTVNIEECSDKEIAAYKKAVEEESKRVSGSNSQ